MKKSTIIEVFNNANAWFDRQVEFIILSVYSSWWVPGVVAISIWLIAFVSIPLICYLWPSDQAVCEEQLADQECQTIEHLEGTQACMCWRIPPNNCDSFLLRSR